MSKPVDRLIEIERESAQRLRSHKSPEIPTVLVARLFDAPDDGGAGRDPHHDGSAHGARERAGRARAG